MTAYGILISDWSSDVCSSDLIAMLGFALALAIPFTLFAMFPSLLKSLPSSGGWLNSVKITLGFLELALALKFLSNVDLAYHWNWFDREDRKSVVSGKSVSVRVDLGGGRVIKIKKNIMKRDSKSK